MGRTRDTFSARLRLLSTHHDSLFATVTWGLWTILGWIFAPHLLVAIYATTIYWDTNPVLVIIAWFFAFGGTAGEAKLTSGLRRR